MADTNQKIREEFEVWAAQNSYVMKTDGDGYCHHQTQTAWDGWNASRAALVIELPSHYCYDRPGDAYPVIQDCREAIEAAGVKVKP